MKDKDRKIKDSELEQVAAGQEINIVNNIENNNGNTDGVTNIIIVRK